MTIPLNNPVELCMDALEIYFQRAMPELNHIIQDFPNPNDDLIFPGLSLTHQVGAGSFTNFQPTEESVSSPPKPDKTVDVVYVVGQWDFKVQLDFWCSSEPERNRIFSKAKDVLNPDINPMGLRLQMPNYHGAWASFTLDGFDHNDGEQASQRGEWRVIVMLLVTCPEIREAKSIAITVPVAINPVLVDNQSVPL
jgi:hypothetical protein